MKQVATNAIVLHRIDFGEAGRIVTMLTPGEGKLTLMAKGVRKPKSKLAGGIELFSISNIVYMHSKSDIKPLVSAQLSKHYGNISQDITRSMLAYDILKFVNNYTESICEPGYFNLIESTFQALNQPHIPAELIWVWFGVRILDISGHGLNLATDAGGHSMNADDRFMFDYQNMAFTPVDSGTYTSAHIKLLRLCQTADIEQLLAIMGSGGAITRV